MVLMLIRRSPRLTLGLSSWRSIVTWPWATARRAVCWAGERPVGGQEALAAHLGDQEFGGGQGVVGAQRGQIPYEDEAVSHFRAGLLDRERWAVLAGGSHAGVVEDVLGVQEMVGRVPGEMGELPDAGVGRADAGAVIHPLLVVQGVDDVERRGGQVLGAGDQLAYRGRGAGAVDLHDGQGVEGVVVAVIVGAERQQRFGRGELVGHREDEGSVRWWGQGQRPRAAVCVLVAGRDEGLAGVAGGRVRTVARTVTPAGVR